MPQVLCCNINYSFIKYTCSKVLPEFVLYIFPLNIILHTYLRESCIKLWLGLTLTNVLFCHNCHVWRLVAGQDSRIQLYTRDLLTCTVYFLCLHLSDRKAMDDLQLLQHCNSQSWKAMTKLILRAPTCLCCLPPNLSIQAEPYVQYTLLKKIKGTLKQHNVTPSQSHFCEIKLST